MAGMEAMALWQMRLGWGADAAATDDCMHACMVPPSAVLMPGVAVRLSNRNERTMHGPQHSMHEHHADL
eukprot:COSAG02_NODE_9472_length_2206_cov_1.906028_2_plen_69_part_00